VVLPVTGATVGLVQVTRGAINTVEAVSEASKGRIWDEVGSAMMLYEGTALSSL
jgi:hypothetical protein